MKLKEFANIYLDRLYEPRVSEDSQSSGWYHLKSLVENKVKSEDLTEELLRPFHPVLRTYLKDNSTLALRLEKWSSVNLS